MLKDMIVALSLGILTMVGALAASAADMKPIHTEKTKDVTVTLQNESGQWKEGKNGFVLEFMSAQEQKPVDVGKVSLSTSMTMLGMAPMHVVASLTAVG